MNADSYNNYMLFLTTLRLYDLVDNYISNNDYCYENVNVISVKNLFNKLSVETFMFLIQNNEKLLKLMKDNITPSNIKFWNECNLSLILFPQRILDINCNNLIQVLNLYISEEFSEKSDKDYLNTRRILLEQMDVVISTIIKKAHHYSIKENEYIDFKSKICINIKEIISIINKLNYDIDEDSNNSLGKKIVIFQLLIIN